MSWLSYFPPSVSQALAGYPSWLVIALGIIAAVIVLWILGKLLKLALYLFLIAVVVGVAGYAIWWALQALHVIPGAAHGP